MVDGSGALLDNPMLLEVTGNELSTVADDLNGETIAVIVNATVFVETIILLGTFGNELP